MRRITNFNHLVALVAVFATIMMVSCFKDDVVSTPALRVESETICFSTDVEWADEDEITRGGGVRNRVGMVKLASADGANTLPMGIYVEDGIHTGASAETRGSKIEAGDIDVLKVWASQTKDGVQSLLFPAEGEEFTLENGIFISDPEYIWPGADYSIDFVAVSNAPASGFTANIINETALESFTYTVPADATAQKDIVVATASVGGANNATVPLHFDHIMSAVQFKVGPQMANGVIKSIKLNNIKTTGSYNVATGTWTPNTDSKGSYSVSFSSVDNGNYEPNDKANGAIINDGECTFMMIPQVLDADAEVVVEFIYDNAPSAVKELRANIAIDPNNTSQRREWKMAKTTYYSLSVDENYNLTITPKGDVLDAHYVMTDITVNIDTETDQAWTLTVEATNIDGDEVSIEYKDKLNTLIKNDGYWINNIVEGTTTTSARGNQTVTGTTKGAHTITVFIPENITADERKITLTLSLDSDPTKAKKTEYLYQMCPYWDREKGFGWERVENSEQGEYGFSWDRVVCYIFNHSFTTGSSQNTYFDNIVNELITKYSASDYVAVRYYKKSAANYRGAVIIDYTKIKQNDFFDFFDFGSGLANTQAFFEASNILAFETALSSVVKKNEPTNKAFRIADPAADDTGYDLLSEPFSVLGSNKESYTAGDGTTYSQTFRNDNADKFEDMSGIINYVIKRNAFDIDMLSSDDMHYYSVKMDSNNIEWYLPAVNQYKDPVLSFATGNTTFTPANFRSSTACEDDNTSAYLGSGTPELRTEKKQVVVQRIVTPIPQPTTISDISTEEMAGGENGEAQWVN